MTFSSISGKKNLNTTPDNCGEKSGLTSPQRANTYPPAMNTNSVSTAPSADVNTSIRQYHSPSIYAIRAVYVFNIAARFPAAPHPDARICQKLQNALYFGP